MKKIFLIEDQVFEESLEHNFCLHMERLGYEIVHSNYEYFRSQKFPFDPSSCIVAYGSINFIRFLIQSKPWNPIAWMDSKKLCCSSYYANWGKYLLQDQYIFLPWKELSRQKEFLFNVFGVNDSIFIRPDNCLKTFTGTVVKTGEYESFLKKTQECYNPEAEQMIVVARPKEISAEWRFVVSDRKIISSSSYHSYGEIDSKGVTEFAIKVALDPWQPSPIYTLDICKLANTKDIRLCEIGSVNCSALYGCDISMVSKELDKKAMEEWNSLYS